MLTGVLLETSALLQCKTSNIQLCATRKGEGMSFDVSAGITLGRRLCLNLCSKTIRTTFGTWFTRASFNLQFRRGNFESFKSQVQILSRIN